MAKVRVSVFRLKGFDFVDLVPRKHMSSFQSQCSGGAYSSSTCEYKWDKSRLLDLNNSLFIFPSLLILMSLVA